MEVALRARPPDPFPGRRADSYRGTEFEGNNHILQAFSGLI
jgi:hypothetical protein